jgi:glutamate dehydrogenase/leucine dehydrogenase
VTDPSLPCSLTSHLFTALQEELLFVPCDVLIPAAIGGVIGPEQAAKISCKAGPLGH